jgi:hypothetical protein
MPTLRRWTEDEISNLKNPAPQIAAAAATAEKAHELKLSLKMRRQNTEEPALCAVPGSAGFDWQEL